METLFVYFIPCLMILFVPFLLAIHTIGRIYEHGLSEKVTPLAMMNLSVMISVIVIVADKQISTLTTMAIVSYSMVAVLLIVIITGSLTIKAWTVVRTRLRLKPVEVAQTQVIAPQVFLHDNVPPIRIEQ